MLFNFCVNILTYEPVRGCVAARCGSESTYVLIFHNIMLFNFRVNKLEATTLINENKSLMTAIRLLNNELQTVLKADNVSSSQPNECDKKE